MIAGFGILGATLLVGGALGIAESFRAYRPIVRPKPRYDASQGFRARVKIHNKGRVAAKKCAVRVVSVREIRPGGVHRRSDIPTIRLHWQDTGGDLLDIVADDDPGIEVVCADFPHPVARLGPQQNLGGGHNPHYATGYGREHTCRPAHFLFLLPPSPISRGMAVGRIAHPLVCADSATASTESRLAACI